MQKIKLLFGFLFLICACKSNKNKTDFTIAFGSCNKHTVHNLLWDDISATNPDIWIWGGDIIYADTDDMVKLRNIYSAQNAVAGYKELKIKTPIIGTWDDHDYGLNDGGVEFTAKKESQKEFLDFMGVPGDSPRRSREGIYAEHDYTLSDGKVKVIVLDTRYFRTALTPDTKTKNRTKPNVYGEGTILGQRQWHWLENVLNTSDADFNIVVSSIQVLSNKHGFETWGNFPHEVDKLKNIISASQAKGVLILSGDRHISEFSKTKVDKLTYPLIDFTSSGLTHAYSSFSKEPNPFRVGEVVSTESFGLITIDFKENKVHCKIIGDNQTILEELEQGY